MRQQLFKPKSAPCLSSYEKTDWLWTRGEGFISREELQGPHKTGHPESRQSPEGRGEAPLEQIAAFSGVQDLLDHALSDSSRKSGSPCLR